MYVVEKKLKKWLFGEDNIKKVLKNDNQYDIILTIGKSKSSSKNILFDEFRGGICMKQKVDKVINEKYFRYEGKYLVQGNLHITHNAKISNLIVEGDLIVDGSISADEIHVDGNLYIAKNMSIEDLYVGGNMDVIGTVCMEGDLYVKGNCQIARFEPKHSNVYIGGKLKTETMSLSAKIHHIVVGEPVNF